MNVIADPFPHAIEDGMWTDDFLDAIAAEFPSPNDARWQHYHNKHEGKLAGGPEMWGESTKLMFEILGSPGMCAELSEAFGIADLTMSTLGGGYHLIPPGGLLAVHADFNRDRKLYRRLNLLIYLNRDWTEDDGGALELWDTDRYCKKVIPVHNRTLIFATSDTSFHGHPAPLPGPRWRKSIAAYYFSPEPPDGYQGDHSTVWRLP